MFAIAVLSFTLIKEPAAKFQAPPAMLDKVQVVSQPQQRGRVTTAAAKKIKSTLSSLETKSRLALASSSKKLEPRPGRFNALQKQNRHFSKLMPPPPPVTKLRSMVRCESSTKTLANSLSFMRKVEHESSFSSTFLPFYLSSELMTIIYNCCIYSRINLELSTLSSQTLSCLTHFFIMHIRHKLICYFILTLKSVTLYKSLVEIVAEKL